jgi:hypothetical protein
MMGHKNEYIVNILYLKMNAYYKIFNIYILNIYILEHTHICLYNSKHIVEYH